MFYFCQFFDQGNYRWVAQVVSTVLFADPNNQAARNLEADALEQDNGDIKVTGDAAKLDAMLGYMDKFEFWFNIVTP